MTHVITVEVTDTGGHLVTDTITVTVSDAPVAESMSVADLDGSSANGGRGGKWSATVTVTVNDNVGDPVSGATVSGDWSNGAKGSSSCTTDGAGQCSVSKGGLKSNAGSATFTATGIAGSLPYSSSDNSDSDGDSDGTVIIIAKP